MFTTKSHSRALIWKVLSRRTYTLSVPVPLLNRSLSFLIWFRNVFICTEACDVLILGKRSSLRKENPHL